MSEKPMTAMSIVSAEMGGYYVSSSAMHPGEYGRIIAAFTSIDDALRFIRDSMIPQVIAMTASQARDYTAQSQSAAKSFI